MTIRPNIDAAKLSAELGNLEACAEHAPAGTYEDAKALAGWFGDVFAYAQGQLSDLKLHGVKLVGDDRYREVEAVLYGAVKACSPDATVFAVAEGFGDAVTNRGRETRERVIRQATSNLEFLKSVGVVQP